MPTNPRLLPHVLVISGETADAREYEIEHPEGCPTVCYWSPHMREIVERGKGEMIGFDPAHRDCYVGYEVDNVGLDSLDLGDDPPDDGTYTPDSRWAMDGWRRLPPGRYLIEAWYTPSYSAGPYGEIEADGGLVLLGAAT